MLKNTSKRILLTGYKGFIGSHLRLALLGHDLHCVDWGDPVPQIHDFDWVIHVGANSSTQERDVEKIFQQNYDYSVDLYNQARHWGVNFQFASSASIYGLGQDFKESAPADPRTPYAWTKWMFERYVARYPSKESHVQIFRYFNVYGPGEEHKGSQASPFTQFAQQARDQGKITVFEGSDRAQRDFVPVATVINYHLKFMARPVSGVFNIGTGTTQSFGDIARSFDVPVVTVPMPQSLKSSYQWYTCADMTKTLKTLKAQVAESVDAADSKSAGQP